MNILFQIKDMEAHMRYVELSLKTLGKSSIGHLRDSVLFVAWPYSTCSATNTFVHVTTPRLA